MLKRFRYLLLPMAFVYGAILWFRNWLFDKQILKSASFNFPIICVGNLATGGTGKTPMTEYLVEVLKRKYQTATLSRGYKRKTKGFAIANENTRAIDIGDEPMQFHQKFPDVIVAVGEERLVAIPQILHQRPDTRVIILDDAFQHRTVKAGMNLLLTEYSNPYTRDLLLPAGNLRDIRSSCKRAEMIIVTKCKPGLSVSEKDAFIEEIKPLPHQKIFFTEIVYSRPYQLFTRTPGDFNASTKVLLICGIANPKPLMEFIGSNAHSYEMIRYADHHIFTTDDLRNIKRHFEKFPADGTIIITTEKDAVRLEKFRAELVDFPIYVLPVKHRFLFNEGDNFNRHIIDFVESFSVSTLI